jgi:4a-hydroxytetrahydrobiopterin dehydratase
MSNLSQQQCIPCRRGDPSLSSQEIQKLMAHLPSWQLLEIDNHPCLQRSYKFKNFTQALNFTNQVGALAEQEDHHPSITTEWGKVTLQWWTHAINGLHRNDFILAARCDELYEQMTAP